MKNIDKRINAYSAKIVDLFHRDWEATEDSTGIIKHVANKAGQWSMAIITGKVIDVTPPLITGTGIMIGDLLTAKAFLDHLSMTSSFTLPYPLLKDIVAEQGLDDRVATRAIQASRMCFTIAARCLDDPYNSDPGPWARVLTSRFIYDIQRLKNED